MIPEGKCRRVGIVKDGAADRVIRRGHTELLPATHAAALDL